ncbi:cytochrome c1 [Woodsholea maritima]|uniref:cytochrome c1 n=1 Tax=Woodsholea maritima TaxID=240237 RepID=UPI00036BA6E1|nr:cytochrome c1 [Woodsholea maritima]
MTIVKRLLVAAVGALALAAPALAAGGDQHHPEEHTWSFEGPFGTFDRAAVRRGFQVYQNVCAACHSMKLLSIRNLGEKNGPFRVMPDPEHEGEVIEYTNPNDNPYLRAIAANYIIVDGPDSAGEMFERTGRPSDRFPSPFANEQQARASNGGAYPPDFSVIVKARHQGPEYIRSLLLGYGHEVPHDVHVAPGQYYNPYFPGGKLAMPPQLREGIVDYEGDIEATPEQMAHDVVAFLSWASDPKMEERKQLGLMVMIYLFIFAILMWFAYRAVWANVEH